MTASAMSKEKIREGGIIAYALFGGAIIIAPTAFAGVIYAYLTRQDAAGTVLESHLTWLIRTFWITLIVSVVGIVLLLILIGWLILAAVSLWYIYRIVKGFVLFSDNKPIVDPRAWF